MNATFKILALLLVAVMMIGIFSGCQNATPSTTPAVTTSGEDSDGTTVSDKKDVKKLTIMVMNSAGGDFDLNNFSQTNVYTGYMALLEKYGLEIEWQIIEEDQYNTALTTTLASGLEEMPDAMFLGGLDVNSKLSAVESGLFLPIQDVLEYSDGTAKKFYDEHPLYFGKNNYKGKTYWFGEYSVITMNGEPTALGMGAPTGMNLREDWLRALGMLDDIPNTIDEIESYILACQAADLNQTGVVDEYHVMYGDSISRSDGVKNYYGVPSGHFAVNLQTKQIETPWENANVKEYLKKLVDWINKGVISQDMIGATSASTWRKNNKTASYSSYYCDNWSFVGCPVPDGAEKCIIIGTFPDKSVHPNAYIGHDSVPQLDVRCFAFASDCDPEAAGRLMDMLISDEYNQLLYWGTEGDSFAFNSAGEKVHFEGSHLHTAPGSQPTSCTGRPLLSFGVFPEATNSVSIEQDIAECAETELMEYGYREGMKWDVVYPNQPAAFLAVPTQEESETLVELETDYTTIADEIYVQILMGQIDIDTEWETKVMEPLKAAGLEQIKAIYQARLDRYFSAAG